MAQFARPDSDISDGLWEPQGSSAETSLWESLDEVSPDNAVTYIEALDGENTTCEIGLSNVTDPVSSAGHIIHFTLFGAGSGGPERCEVQLFQGAVQKATTGTQANRGSWGTKTYSLTAGEADSITDYTDLRFKIISSNLGATEDMWVTWAQFEVPDVAAGPSIPIAMYHHMKHNLGS